MSPGRHLPPLPSLNCPRLLSPLLAMFSYSAAAGCLVACRLLNVTPDCNFFVSLWLVGMSLLTVETIKLCLLGYICFPEAKLSDQYRLETITICELQFGRSWVACVTCREGSQGISMDQSLACYLPTPACFNGSRHFPTLSVSWDYTIHLVGIWAEWWLLPGDYRPSWLWWGVVTINTIPLLILCRSRLLR